MKKSSFLFLLISLLLLSCSSEEEVEVDISLFPEEPGVFLFQRPYTYTLGGQVRTKTIEPPWVQVNWEVTNSEDKELHIVAFSATFTDPISGEEKEVSNYFSPDDLELSARQSLVSVGPGETASLDRLIFLESIVQVQGDVGGNELIDLYRGLSFFAVIRFGGFFGEINQPEINFYKEIYANFSAP